MNKPAVSNMLLASFLIVALLGFADAAYLTAKHYAGAIPPCSLVNGCETVLTSPYATPIGNVPLALIGATYYLLLFLAAIAYGDTRKELFIKSAAYMTWAGFFVSIGLVTLQLTIIDAVCLYCMASAASSAILFVLGMVILKKLKKQAAVGSV
jgi:uncharacterized membrane protein